MYPGLQTHANVPVSANLGKASIIEEPSMKHSSKKQACAKPFCMEMFHSCDRTCRQILRVQEDYPLLLSGFGFRLMISAACCGGRKLLYEHAAASQDHDMTD